MLKKEYLHFYSKRNGSNIQLIDKNDYFLLFEITKIDKILPNKTDHKFIDKIKDNIFIKKKYDLHQELFKKIQEKKLDNNEFVKISQNQKNIKNITIKKVKLQCFVLEELDVKKPLFT